MLNTRDTQSASFKALGYKRLGQQMQEILDIVRLGHERGAVNMSLTEIRDLYEATYQRRIDLGTVSGRVRNLVDAGRLVRTDDSRACSVSKKIIRPVRMPLRQARLVA